jgi:hypothetical protein
MDYWFPAKPSGLGWGPPTKWQGWAFLFGWMFLLTAGTRSLGYGFHSLVFIGGMIAVLLLVISFKGEPRRLS